MDPFIMVEIWILVEVVLLPIIFEVLVCVHSVLSFEISSVLNGFLFFFQKKSN